MISWFAWLLAPDWCLSAVFVVSLNTRWLLVFCLEIGCWLFGVLLLFMLGYMVFVLALLLVSVLVVAYCFLLVYFGYFCLDNSIANFPVCFIYGC